MRLETAARATAKIALYIVPDYGMLSGTVVVLHAVVVGGRAVLQGIP
jgi:hypothetical protein